VLASHRAASSSRTQMLPTGPRIIAPHLLAAAHTSRAPTASPIHARPLCPRDVRRPPLFERPRAITPMPCRLTRHHTPAPPSPLVSCPHKAPSRPLPPLLFFPLPCRERSKAPAAVPLPFAAPLPLARAQARRCLPLPPVTQSTHLGRQNRRSPPRFSAIECRRRRFLPTPPTVRPSQSTAIFHFGAALTSLILPYGSWI
jgi:hypothetical protein